MYHGNLQPSFLKAITHILGLNTLKLSFFDTFGIQTRPMRSYWDVHGT